MLLEVDPDCFEPDADLRLILDLIHLVQSERHEWQPSQATALAADDYFEAKLGKGKHDRPEYLLVKKSLEASTYPQRQTNMPTARITAEHLQDLLHDLGRPMAIVVENRFTDGECLMFQARLFQRERIVRAEREGWIEFCNSGGCGQMRDHGVDQRRWFRRLIRLLVVVDGDIRVPGKASEHEQMIDKLRALGMLGFIWPGLELENFLPVYVLVEGHGQDARGWATSIRALPWTQRAHIDMKRGLPDPANPAPRQRVPTADEISFHNTIDAGHRAVLIGRGYKIPNYERMRARPATARDLADLPTEAQRAIGELLDLIESVL